MLRILLHSKFKCGWFDQWDQSDGWLDRSFIALWLKIPVNNKCVWTCASLLSVLWKHFHCVAVYLQRVFLMCCVVVFAVRFSNVLWSLQRVFLMCCVVVFAAHFFYMLRMCCQIDENVVSICLCFVFLHAFSEVAVLWAFRATVEMLVVPNKRRKAQFSYVHMIIWIWLFNKSIQLDYDWELKFEWSFNKNFLKCYCSNPVRWDFCQPYAESEIKEGGIISSDIVALVNNRSPVCVCFCCCLYNC